MTDWAQVRWTEASQVVALQTSDPAALPDSGISPQAHFLSLRNSEQRDEAVGFLGLALPRFEAIAWAAHIVEQEAGGHRLSMLDRQALDYSLRWIGDANDDRRRAAFEAAGQAGERAPERLLAMAVFFSGGSISMPDLPPVLPPPEAVGKFTAGAICVAAHRGTEAKAVLDRALDLGEKIAVQGTRALQKP